MTGTLVVAALATNAAGIPAETIAATLRLIKSTPAAATDYHRPAAE